MRSAQECFCAKEGKYSTNDYPTTRQFARTYHRGRWRVEALAVHNLQRRFPAAGLRFLPSRFSPASALLSRAAAPPVNGAVVASSSLRTGAIGAHLNAKAAATPGDAVGTKCSALAERVIPMRRSPSAFLRRWHAFFSQRRTIASAGWMDSSNGRRPSRVSMVSALCRRQQGEAVESRCSVIDPRWPGGLAGDDRRRIVPRMGTRTRPIRDGHRREPLGPWTVGFLCRHPLALALAATIDTALRWPTRQHRHRRNEVDGRTLPF